MIDVVYNRGSHTWRESAIQAFSLTLTDLDKKTKKPVELHTIGVLKEVGMVYIFYHQGDTLDDCNELIGSSVGEIDLRMYDLYAVHTLEEFLSLQDPNKRNQAELLEGGKYGLEFKPTSETRERIKQEKNEERKAKRAAAKEANNTAE